MDYLLQEFEPSRIDTRATHIRNCQKIIKDARAGAGSTSGWGGPGAKAFDMLADVANLMLMEVGIRIVEDALIDLGYDETPETHYGKSKMFEGEYCLTPQAAGGYWSITVKHDPALHAREELMVILAPLLDGFSGPEENWEDGFTVAGPVRVI
jgi:hypothetical protein